MQQRGLVRFVTAPLLRQMGEYVRQMDEYVLVAYDKQNILLPAGPAGPAGMVPLAWGPVARPPARPHSLVVKGRRGSRPQCASLRESGVHCVRTHNRPSPLRAQHVLVYGNFVVGLVVRLWRVHVPAAP